MMPSPAEIAAALEETAIELAKDVEGCEHLAAMLRSPGVTDTLNKLKRRAELVGEAHRYFMEKATA